MLIRPAIIYYENVLADCSAVVMVISEVEVGAEDVSQKYHSIDYNNTYITDKHAYR